MEQKHILMSALSVGVGVGVGLGLASGQTVSKWASGNSSSNTITVERMEQDLLRQIVDGRESNVAFDEFPYYLSEQTRVLLTSAASFHLKQAEFSKYTRNLSPASRSILLSGPAEMYQQMLAKALAHYFEAKLLLFDATDFSLKIQSKYGCSNKETPFKRSISETTLERMSSFIGSLSLISPNEENKGGAPLKRTSSWSFDEKLLVHALYKALVSVSKTSPIVLYLRDVEKLLFRSPRIYTMFQKMLKKLSGSILILGSRIVDPENDYTDLDDDLDERLGQIFPYNIEIKPPEDESHLVSRKNQLEEDMKMIKFQDNRNHITEVLSANDLECDDLGSICLGDTMVLSNYIEEIVVSAISYHLMNNKEPEYRNGKLVISSKSLSYGLDIFKQENVPDNEFEKRIRPKVIPASDIGVTFEDIGTLDEIKESLQDLVMLPLRRPDLFKGGLLKPCRGILLFGPPGTGKTMLAKAIANEAGASFINVSMSTITSKWYGEDEKIVRALFTLAAKVSPTIIFVDEVDSMLWQRKIKNEFMTHWDGLLTKPGERILVLAATNRPFDLDEAIIRRFERRIMVGLPSVENRELILKTLLSKESIEEGLDFKELASMTEGYTGSDLKNLCTTAAYRPVRELIQQERVKELERKKRGDEEQSSEKASDTNEGKTITLRPLNMEDMRQAKNQVAASFASQGSIMGALKQWNELYGEGGSRKKEQLSYFL